MTKAQEKYNLCISGEYGVASELAKRGFHVSITFGNAKAVDIVIMGSSDNDQTYKTIEVKTSRSKRFVTGFFQKYGDKTTKHPDYWVIVYIDSNNLSHFYILSHEDLGQIQMKRNNMDKWEFIKGCDNVLLSQIKDFEGKWDTITI